jgi:hypothetical protein
VLQDVEKVRQLGSRIAQRLNIRKTVCLAASLAAAALDGLFEHPAGVSVLVRDIQEPDVFRVSKYFSNSLLISDVGGRKIT